VKNLKLFLVAALVVALLAVVPCFVQAGSLSYSGSYSAMTDWSQDLQFQQFDPSNGTLDSVTLVLSTGSLQSTMTVTNISNLLPLFGPAEPSTGNVSTQSVLMVQDPLDLLSSQVALTVPNQPYSLGTPASGNVTSVTLSTVPAAPGSGTPQTSVDSPVLTEFTSTTPGVPSYISLPAFTQTTVSLIGNHGGQSNASQVSEAGLTATVTYDYTPTTTPEPSMFALLAVGVLGLLGYGWWKR